jgi:5-formyltetrahydrofolate cyclo-ligase
MVDTDGVANPAQVAKAALRERLLADRLAMDPDVRTAAGIAIATHGRSQLQNHTSVAAYLAIGSEPPTAPMLDELRGGGVRVLLPVMEGPTLTWATYSGAGALAAGPLGINEPVGPRLGADAILGVDVVIAPALAVDRHGNRLGRGRGYYDRALAQVSVPIVAIVYDDELLDEVPTESHDRRVTAVLRPAGFTSLG